MTPAERKALIFLALVAVLGAGVRAIDALQGDATPPTAARAELARQIEAVDSATASRRSRKRDGGKRPRAAGSRDRGPAGNEAGTAIVPRDSASERPAVSYQVSRPPVDLDVATGAEIEALPGIGPALASRIVADRDSAGPFGSLGEFERVRGVGPALAKRLEPLVTFSLTPRHPGAVSRGASRSRERPDHRVKRGRGRA
jgi:predicted flap endonuclease-1-like 5' DNA nuclease